MPRHQVGKKLTPENNFLKGDSSPSRLHGILQVPSLSETGLSFTTCVNQK